MLHQLPSDLTPPSERENLSPHPPPSPPKNNRPRPPWDPRPGHFHNGRPEYIRPPRPSHKNEAFKRIDNLPNILPQFRPNVKLNNQHNPPPHYFDHHGGGKNAFLRQPLLERPSNRPIGFIEKVRMESGYFLVEGQNCRLRLWLHTNFHVYSWVKLWLLKHPNVHLTWVVTAPRFRAWKPQYNRISL